ncbi:MAG: cupin domain-containing protein [Nocardioidaceae bacterium]
MAKSGEAVWVEQVSDLEGETVHAACTKAVLHTTPASESSVFQVAPGGEVRPHLHSVSWDLFLGLVGHGEISFKDDEAKRTVTINPGSFCAIPPRTVHAVRNAGDEPFHFLLVHAPYEGYDHRAAELG